VWYFENHAWNSIVGGDASEVGSGPGSYNIHMSVWHVNCCNPEINGGGGWGIFNAIFGWTNSATYGSVISYNLYWLVVIAAFLSMRYYEKAGHWPLMKASPAQYADDFASDDDSRAGEGVVGSPVEKKADDGAVPASSTVRELTV
jgi:high-affinity iron transporter